MYVISWVIKLQYDDVIEEFANQQARQETWLIFNLIYVQLTNAV